MSQICSFCWDDYGLEVKAVTQRNGTHLCADCVSGKPRSSPKKVPPQARNFSKTEAVAAKQSAFVMTKTEYAEKYGVPKKRGLSPATVEIWAKVMELRVGQMLVLPCGDKKAAALRSTLSNSVQRLVREYKAPFKIRMFSNAVDNHVVLEKLPLEKAEP